MKNFLTQLRPLFNSPYTLITLLYTGAMVVGILQIHSLGIKKTIPPSPKAIEGNIAVLPIQGIISGSAQHYFSPSSSDRIVRRLKELSEKKNVKAVVLRINSPGGSVSAVQEIYEEVLKLKKTGKKVVASIGDISASGGYYIACAADLILAEPGSLTGSIGVIMQVGNYQELFKKIGVHIQVIKSAPYKDIASPFREMTPQEKAMIQNLIDETYNQFVAVVRTREGIDLTKIDQITDGRIFSGSQAKTLGMIDEIGNLQTAIYRAGYIAGIRGPAKVWYEDSPLQKFLSYFSQDSKVKIWDIVSSIQGIHLAYLWEYAL
jgi:protease-4